MLKQEPEYMNLDFTHENLDTYLEKDDGFNRTNGQYIHTEDYENKLPTDRLKKT